MTQPQSSPLAPVLTARMQPVVDVIGWDAAIALVGLLGGTRVAISSDEQGTLARSIGVAAARAMAAALGPGTMDIPRCVSWMVARRNEEIVARWLAGETQGELALRFRLTERHIRSIVRSDAPTSSPPAVTDLFEPSPQPSSPT